MNNTVLRLHTLQTMNLPLALLSHLSSLSPLLKTIKQKKTAGTSHKKVFQMKIGACRDETLKNQPNKMGTTLQHIHTIPTFCAILPTIHTKNSLHELAYSHLALYSEPRHELPNFENSAIHAVGACALANLVSIEVFAMIYCALRTIFYLCACKVLFWIWPGNYTKISG